MKRILSLTFAFVVATVALFGCGKPQSKIYRVYMPDGAPAIALSALMNSGYDGAEFTVVTADEINPAVSTGKADFAIMPINAAAALYNAGTDIVMLTVNTHGNLYIMGGNTRGVDLDALVGSNLGVIGQGQVPDFTLRILLEKRGIEFAVTELRNGAIARVPDKIALYYGAPTTLVPLFKTGKLDYVLLGEPAATACGGTFAVDMQDQWIMSYDDEYPQACLVVKGEVIDNDRAFVDKFIDAVQKSDGWAAKNPESAVAAISNHMKSGVQPQLTSLGAAVIERCNISTVPAEDCRELCDMFFTRLTTLYINEIKVLEKAPTLDFYYQ